ncbi:metal ABC transporter ATP-binding protein [Cellulomonas fimi]|uniref:Metal ABC transporter ATP-binding protein n=2 Tax=Cellulomonas fimi TaxID=1708 RepID=A0A7Y0QHG0_CELFI|nr:metal ABC transporter ATP-binding protein [Cellulomonas fimi]
MPSALPPDGRLLGPAGTAGEPDGDVPREVPAIRLRDARMSFGDRLLWDNLDLDVAAGEFVAVLGPNGSGKTTLLKVLLGLLPLSAGSLLIDGEPARRGSPRIGYIPQQTSADPELALRGRDLVGFGWDGHRMGMSFRRRAVRRRRVHAALAAVEATDYADVAVGRLSGGELQRLRVAQALVGDPAVLLCDEPFLGLDLAHQRTISRLIDDRRRTTSSAVVFVTHEINPVLHLVDRVVYLVNGRFRIGTPAEVMTSEVLSDLYGTDVDVVTVRGRLVVVGAEDDAVPRPGHAVHHVPDRAVR